MIVSIDDGRDGSRCLFVLACTTRGCPQARSWRLFGLVGFARNMRCVYCIASSAPHVYASMVLTEYVSLTGDAQRQN